MKIQKGYSFTSKPKKKYPNMKDYSDRELELWTMNDEDLYNQALKHKDINKLVKENGLKVTSNQIKQAKKALMEHIKENAEYERNK